jgi:hypothetical protein
MPNQQSLGGDVFGYRPDCRNHQAIPAQASALQSD